MTALTRVHDSHGPGTLPITGGRLRPALALRRNPVEFAESTWREHGDIVRMVLGPRGADREVWWLHHPDAAARVLSGSSWRTYAKRDRVYEEIAYWLGPGLLAAEGDEWTRQRTMLQPAFTKEAVHGYADLMVEEIEAFISGWDAGAPVTLDLSDHMQHLTLQVVLRALFGESASDAVPHVRRSFPSLSETIVRRGLGPVALPRAIPTRTVRRGRAARADLLAVCDRLITARREGPETASDLLGRLLTAHDANGPLSDDEVRAQVLVFLLAGHETTSTALTFALHLLGQHQDVQGAVRSEVRAVLGNSRPTATTAANLPCTTAALKEAMRLYPSAPMLGRLTLQDDEIMGHRVTRGTNVVVVPWTIHRHPDLWVDPLVYDPSRFTGDGTRPAPAHRYAWMPFGGGPRACIGQHFSMVEAVLALALILREHRVTPATTARRPRVSAAITLVPTEPILATITRIA
ncbi:cytochrome P450 [Ornithinibacter aureus]|uniref:Cytochrome P450 n=1 Tax=Ornithinibacter aureus TaxID=622664 RepID=A0ABP8K806_9MICO|nr:cytochrome P450 [Ornithinibacter aureus]KAF0833609.1 cytochrome P450 [Ornithinibacter aureus]